MNEDKTINENAVEEAIEETKDARREALHQIAKLMRRTSFFESQKFRNREYPDIRRGQGRILALLAIKPEMTQKELSMILDMSKQALAEMLGKLEASGYVERVQSEEDKRVHIVRITEEGAKAAEKMAECNKDKELKSALDDLSDDDVEKLVSILDTINAGLDKCLPEDFKERMRNRRRFEREYGGCGPHGGPHGHGHGPHGGGCGPHHGHGPQGNWPRPHHCHGPYGGGCGPHHGHGHYGGPNGGRMGRHGCW